MKALNTRFNKANWSAAVNAGITLVNGRLPAEIQLSTDEMGLLMTVVTFLIVCLVPNAETSK